MTLAALELTLTNVVLILAAIALILFILGRRAL